ncbi:MoaD/ThiS family protein [Candidatus Woesearchaeota archaeon]|nr:MoaD/ThiS family protein [Candidatus Woesearchaeota archaeon]
MARVYIDKEDRIITIAAGTVRELLQKLKIPSNTVIVTRNDEIIIETEKLNQKDNLKIIYVVSGG